MISTLVAISAFSSAISALSASVIRCSAPLIDASIATLVVMFCFVIDVVMFSSISVIDALTCFNRPPQSSSPSSARPSSRGASTCKTSGKHCSFGMTRRTSQFIATRASARSIRPCTVWFSRTRS